MPQIIVPHGSDRPSDIGPEDARLYLLGEGWQFIGSSQYAALLRAPRSRAEDVPSEVLLPLLPRASDFSRRWQEFLDNVARVGRTTPEAVAEAILFAGADIAEWRAQGVGTSDYTIPLADAERLIHGAKDAVIAAASATIHRRGYFGRSKPQQARQHANAVRMGQTRRGSYVIPIISRVPVMEPESERESDEARLDIQTTVLPFERQVMSRLAESLSAVQQLAVESDRLPSMREINETVQLGVSSELCASIASSLEAESVSSIDISFSWSPRIGQMPDAPRFVDFPRDAQVPIRRISERLRESQVVASQQIVGYVENLHRGESDEVGVVTVRAETGRVRRQVKMSLSPEDYERATLANNERRPVIATGTLHREAGKPLQLRDVTGFGYAEFLSAPNLPEHSVDIGSDAPF